MKDYMHDINFLLALDNDHNKIIYAKIISLTRDEQPIEAIEGVVQSGSINIDGASAVRRSCNLTMTTKLLNINEVYWGFTTKVKIEIGLQNNVDSRYDKIIWFKQGIFILTDFKTSSQVNNYVITIQGKDKMCLLNGDISGHFNAETNLKIENEADENGNITEIERPIKYIIREMIHRYAQEPWANIVINNIEDYGLEMLENKSDTTYYLWFNQNRHEYTHITNKDFESQIQNDQFQINQISFNGRNYENIEELLSNSEFQLLNGVEEDSNSLIASSPASVIIVDNIPYNIFKIDSMGAAGYRSIDLVYDKELIAAAGETVTSILDKIVQFLGPFEYFYNVDGQFIFKAKDTYLTTKWTANQDLDSPLSLSYITPALMRDKTSYYFENGQLTTAIQNNPNILNIRNDFTIWGKRTTTTQSEIPIHARYAIDKKPLFYQPLDTSKKPYFTEEGRAILQSLTNVGPQENYRKHSLPKCFQGPNKNDWWHIEDWAEYYAAYTGGQLPQAKIGTYSNINSTGYSGNLYFANSLTINPNSYGLGGVPFCIVDIQRLEDDECIPAGFIGIGQNANGTEYLRFLSPLSPFQHRFKRCNHNYNYFMDLMRQGYESYIYQPILNFAEVSNPITNKANELIGMLDADPNQIVDWRELIYLMAEDYFQHNHEDEFEINIATANRDISQLMHLTDYLTGKTGYEQYYHDIQGFWRMLYDPNHKNTSNILPNNGPEITYDNLGWNINIEKDPTQLIFWFDFYETNSSSIGKFSVPAIGQRTKVVKDDDVRVIIYPDTPDIIYANSDIEHVKIAHPGYSCLQVSENDFINNLSRAIRHKSAKETMDNLLYNYSHTNDNITLTTVPIYYLQPNTIIHVHDELSHIDGYYEVNKITLPLTYNGTMSIQAIKIPQQIY